MRPSEIAKDFAPAPNQCQDCIYFPKCDEYPFDESGCEDFKDHSGFVELPCKIGDTVYRMLPHEDFVMECTVVEFCITARTYMIVREVQFNARRGVEFTEIGKSVFLTREEAESAIRERRCNSGK